MVNGTNFPECGHSGAAWVAALGCAACLSNQRDEARAVIKRQRAEIERLRAEIERLHRALWVYGLEVNWSWSSYGQAVFAESASRPPWEVARAALEGSAPKEERR